MKKMFKGFYNLDETELADLWKYDKTIFVFDSNVLLNLYGYAKQTRDDFFKILDAINDKLWIPYQVGLEYQRRRLNIIKNEKGVFNNIENNLDKIQKVFRGDFEQLALKRRFPKLFENTEKLEKEINKSILNYKKSVALWDNEQPCVRSHDGIRDQINKFFDNKVGNKPENQKWLDELYKEGIERFEKKIPPGFKDAGKGRNEGETHFYYDGLHYERQFGDLILWKQLLTKSQDDNVENVIFITDDSKEDWWYEINSNGKKIIGPLAELQAEIFRESNINKFHMYSTSMFLEEGKSNLSVEVNESSIEDANTAHITKAQTSIEAEWAKTLLRTYEPTGMDSERMNELLRTYKPTGMDSERMKELLRAYEPTGMDSERMKELLRAYEPTGMDSERMKELLRAYEPTGMDSERMRRGLMRNGVNNVNSILEAILQHSEIERLLNQNISIRIKKERIQHVLPNFSSESLDVLYDQNLINGEGELTDDGYRRLKNMSRQLKKMRARL